MPLVSLCMIAKNEERHIRRCLDSARLLADELVVVDTGSTDNTPALCGEFGARVLTLPWEDNFAAARNFGLEQASGDWILWMDADEELKLRDPEGIRSRLSDSPEIFWGIRMRHDCGPAPEGGRTVYRSCSPRLFRNRRGVRFEGRIHEQPAADGGPPEPLRPLPGAELLHFGYREDAGGHKSKRNLRLLLPELQSRPDDGWLHYHLAAEHRRSRELRKALESIDRSLLSFLKSGLTPPALAYGLKYEILLESKSYDLVLRGAGKAISLYPDYVDLHYRKGLALLRLGLPRQAAAVFSHCLVLGEGRLQYLTLEGTGGHLALRGLCSCYEAMGLHELAEECRRRADLLRPDHTPFERCPPERPLESMT